jgi:ubiquinone/menaquinone biosynthesis C-methylase UbiE
MCVQLQPWIAMTRLLSHAQAARFYDLLGAGQDTQAFYETAALRDLVEHLKFGTCHSVVEFGFGTGRLAAELLSMHLPADATYLGLDVSATMVHLAKNRLRPFAARADVRQSDGTSRIDAEDDSFDRFISTYVFDLLSEDDIQAVITEARRVLKPGGLLGIVSLTDGLSPFSRLVSTTWRGLHRISPWLIGGCRPIALANFISNMEWRIEHWKMVVRFGMPSEVVVARAL